MTSPPVTAVSEFYCTYPHCECSSGASERCAKAPYPDEAKIKRFALEDGRPLVKGLCDELLRARSALSWLGGVGYQCAKCAAKQPRPLTVALADVGAKCATCGGEANHPPCWACDGKQPRPAAEAVCTHCMFTPSERARPDHYRVRPCRYCSPAAHTAQVTRALEYGNTVAGFIGWLSADIPELRCVEVPRLAESYDRFLRRLAEQGSGAK